MLQNIEDNVHYNFPELEIKGFKSGEVGNDPPDRWFLVFSWDLLTAFPFNVGCLMLQISFARGVTVEFITAVCQEPYIAAAQQANT